MGAEDEEEVPERSEGDHRQGLRRRASRANADIAADNDTTVGVIVVVVVVVVSTTKKRGAGVWACRPCAAASTPSSPLQSRLSSSLFQLLLGGACFRRCSCCAWRTRPAASLTVQHPQKDRRRMGKVVRFGRTDSSGDARGIPTTHVVVGFGRPSVSVPICYTVRIYVLWLSTN
jgi:hypothetical protein